MPLNDEENAAFKLLKEQLENDAYPLFRLDAYYEGEQRLEQLGLAVPPELRRFLVIVNWPRLSVDGIEERLDVEGFRYPGTDEADDELWRIWQANNLDEESQLGHTDALVFGRSFICIGSNEDDPATPIVTVESPQEMTCDYDPRTRRVRSALRVYNPDEGGTPHSATLYLPDDTVWLDYVSGGWEEVDRDNHGLGVTLVVPLVYRSRTARRAGASRMKDVIDLTDACARALTNAQVASELLAVPQRYVLGATKGDFVDSDGKPLTAWEAYFGAVWAHGNENAKAGQFDGADLSNFETVVKLYATLVRQVTGLPTSYLGFETTNPPSADAIRASEARLIKICERTQTPFSGSWEQAQRIVDRIKTGEWNPELRRLETLWRDPATPTVAQKADATVKLVQAGILPVEAAWEDMGYSEARKDRLRQMRAREVDTDLLGSLSRQFQQE